MTRSKTAQHSSQSRNDTSSSPLVYALLFTAFGLFVLTIFSRRYEQRQLEIEQKFHGIQKIQQGSSSAGEGQNRLPTPADRPLIITLRPLMITLGALMVGAWAMLMWRRSLRPGKPHQGGHM